MGESFELGSCQCREARQFSGVLGKLQVPASSPAEPGQLSCLCLHLLELVLMAYLACVAVIPVAPIAAKPGENEGRRIWESFAFAVAKATCFELDRHSLITAAILLPYGNFEWNQTPEGEKKWE